MKPRATVPVLVLAAAAFSVSAWAVHPKGPEDLTATVPEVTEPRGEGPFPPFAQLDTDGDGRLGPEEAAAVERLGGQFKAADVDQSGYLDESEFSAFEVREGVMPGLDGSEE